MAAAATHLARAAVPRSSSSTSGPTASHPLPPRAQRAAAVARAAAAAAAAGQQPFLRRAASLLSRPAAAAPTTFPVAAVWQVRQAAQAQTATPTARSRVDLAALRRRAARPARRRSLRRCRHPRQAHSRTAAPLVATLGRLWSSPVASAGATAVSPMLQARTAVAVAAATLEAAAAALVAAAMSLLAAAAARRI